MGDSLGWSQHLGDGSCQPLPLAFFGFELLAPGFREFVVFRAAVVIGGAPAGLDPAAAFEAMQRRIQRALLNLQNLARDLMEALGNAPAVLGAEGESSENQEIQSSLRKFDALLIAVRDSIWHSFPLSFDMYFYRSL